MTIVPNWWSIFGLTLNLIGICGIVLATHSLLGTARWEPTPARRWTVRVSWLNLLGDYGLQLVGQFVP